MSSDAIFTPPEIKPSAVNLSDILAWVRQGRLRPTRFQRPFRWDRARVRDLFDSIRKQYPIGSLLIWVSNKDRPTRDTLGPLKLPPRAGGPLLLIDGQQRVTSIAGVLLNQQLAHAEGLEDAGMWELWFDAKDLSFRHFDREPPPPTCIRVRDLLSVRTLMKAAEPLVIAKREEEEIQQILDAWQAAATSLAAYRVPIVEFHTDDLKLAVESFTRLNRRGLDISEDEMFSALAEDESREKRLADYIDESLAAAKAEGFGDLDRLTVLRLTLLELDLDPFRTDWNQLTAEKQGSTREHLEAVAQRSQRSLLRALQFMRDRLTLGTTRLLPYSGILIGLATYLGPEERELSPEERSRLVAWVWHAAFAGFAEGNPSRATQVWRALKAAGQQPTRGETLPSVVPNARATPFPLRFDLRSARLQASLWAEMTEWGWGEEKVTKLGHFINLYGPQAWRRLFRPRRGDVSPRLRELLSSPANRVFDLWGLDELQLSREGEIRKRILALGSPSMFSSGSYGDDEEGMLTRLHISEAAFRALKANNEEEFLSLRLQTMVADERSLMERLAVQPPEDSAPKSAAIDHEGAFGLDDDL